MSKLPPLEIKRMKLDLINVRGAKAAMEFRIDERLEEIEQLKANIKKQELKEEELLAKIAEQEGME